MEAEGGIAQIRRVIGVGEAVYVAAGARAEVVRALGAPELRAPDRVVMQGEAVVALMPVSSGVTLAEALREGGQLSAGGCVWVGTRVASALARLHRAGMAHGSVDADSILIESGSAVLLDAGAGVSSATQSDDVAALGRLLRSAVRASDVDVIAAWTDPMSAEDPAGRPTAAMVARALPGAAQERPVAVPGPSVASRMRESLTVGDQAPMDDGRGKGKPASVRPQGAPAAREQAPAGRWSAWAAGLKRSPRRLAVLAATATTALVVLAIAASAWGLSDRTGTPAADATENVPVRVLSEGVGVAGPGDPAAAAAALTERRFSALADGDSRALVATTALGSPARERAEAQAASVASGSLAYEGLDVSVESASLTEDSGDRAVVAVEYTTSAFVATVDGEATPSEALTEQVELTLVADHGRWRVSEVSAG